MILLYDLTCGYGNDVISHKNEKKSPKSIGGGMTLPNDESNINNLRNIVLNLSRNIENRLKKYDLFTKCIKVTIKDNQFNTKDIQTTISQMTRNSYYIYESAMRILEKDYLKKNPIRAITVTAIVLEREKQINQISFFDNDYPN